VVLKGAGSLIAHPDGRLALSSRSSGHGHRRAGRCARGLTGALLAQGMDGFDAACLAVWLHANAGSNKVNWPWAGGQ
jgi:NAD(P)H-hydrate epimerase